MRAHQVHIHSFVSCLAQLNGFTTGMRLTPQRHFESLPHCNREDIIMLDESTSGSLSLLFHVAVLVS